MKSVSIVVPIYNEEENVVRLHEEINASCKALGRPYEIIFVDDGSTDKTAEYAMTLSPVKLIRLRRNFGQTAAMDAGIKAAENDYIITMDGDCQNDPADFPMLISHLEENDLDIVSGWRKDRKDKFFKRFTSYGANVFRKVIVKDNIHDSGCSLKIYKKECFKDINLYGEIHRLIPALLKIKGFTVGEIVVNHRPRVAGKTKYTWVRTVKGFIDMVSVWFWHKYSVRPFHLMGSLGIISALLGVVFGIFTVGNFIVKLFLPDNILLKLFMTDIIFPVLTITCLLTGVLFFVFGLMSDMLIKIYYGSTIDVPYSIKSVYDSEK